MAKQPIQLYYARDSLCSFMLRYTVAIRGPPADGLDIDVEEKEIDIHTARNHLSESFLCNVNPKGQVPVITSPALSEPMSDSLRITRYLSTKFPALIPSFHEAEVNDVLDEIHAFPYFPLSFGGHAAADIPAGTVWRMRELLARQDISDRYRKALEYKLSLVDHIDLSEVLSPTAVEAAEEVAQVFFDEIASKFLEDEALGGTWLFGLRSPSAADAHLLALLVRLRDVGRAQLIPLQLRRYAAMAEKATEWQSVIGDLETTMFLGSREKQSWL